MLTALTQRNSKNEQLYMVKFTNGLNHFFVVKFDDDLDFRIVNRFVRLATYRPDLAMHVNTIAECKGYYTITVDTPLAIDYLTSQRAEIFFEEGRDCDGDNWGGEDFKTTQEIYGDFELANLATKLNKVR